MSGNNQAEIKLQIQQLQEEYNTHSGLVNSETLKGKTEKAKHHNKKAQEAKKQIAELENKVVQPPRNNNNA